MASANIQRLRQRLQYILKDSGIILNGPNPWDPQIKNDRFYARIFANGSLGLGESYMDGWWECDRIDDLITRIFLYNIKSTFKINLPVIKDAIRARIMNRQNRQRAYYIGEKHYDIGNDLYQAMLDARMVYTCGYWKDAQDLDTAQENKLDLVCRKIGVKPGQTILDIGCGWGSFAKFAAERYGAHVTGITVSKEQAKLAEDRCAGLPVTIRLQDYRDVNEKFDHVISLGMFEHVGYKNYRTYFNVARRCIKDDGFFLLHTIGGNISTTSTDPWIERYIFPNSMIPSVKQIAVAGEGLFVMEDWHNFGSDYDKTLLAWYHNVESHWNELEDHYNDRFHRMWRFYLLCCAGTFRSRLNQLWEVVFSPNGVPGGYVSIR